jgi:hypothetical protein
MSMASARGAMHNRGMAGALKPPTKASPATGPAQGSPFVGVLYECCNVYTRIYRAASAQHYDGRCPRCLRPVRFVVGPGGAQERFWRVG